MRRFAARATVLATIVALVVGVLTVTAPARGHSLTVDVAEDPSRFVFNGDHVFTEGDLAGLPAYGDFFVTQGWIFPEGTLSEGDPGVACEFDDETGFPVSCEPLYEPIGTWTCYGTHVGDGAATEEGAWVVTTQIFDFSTGGDSNTIVTDGFEGPEVGATAERAVTGGTGKYRRARGEQHQVFLGLHPELFNARMTSTLEWRG